MLSVDVPSVRYAYGAQVLEPYMDVQLSGLDRHLSPVQKEVGQRRGRTTEIERHDNRFLLLAEVPLANLLGYADELQQATAGGVSLRMRLSRYVRID